MMVGHHSEPSAYAPQMLCHREAMKHARLIALAAMKQQTMSSQAVRGLVRGLVAALMAAMPDPSPVVDLVEVSIPADVQAELDAISGNPPTRSGNGWGPKPDPLAAPDLIKG